MCQVSIAYGAMAWNKFENRYGALLDFRDEQFVCESQFEFETIVRQFWELCRALIIVSNTFEDNFSAAFRLLNIFCGTIVKTILLMNFHLDVPRNDDMILREFLESIDSLLMDDSSEVINGLFFGGARNMRIINSIRTRLDTETVSGLDELIQLHETSVVASHSDDIESDIFFANNQHLEKLELVNMAMIPLPANNFQPIWHLAINIYNLAFPLNVHYWRFSVLQRATTINNK